MGLFDRLFGRKKEEQPAQQEVPAEGTESPGDTEPVQSSAESYYERKEHLAQELQPAAAEGGRTAEDAGVSSAQEQQSQAEIGAPEEQAETEEQPAAGDSSFSASEEASETRLHLSAAEGSRAELRQSYAQTSDTQSASDAEQTEPGESMRSSSSALHDEDLSAAEQSIQDKPTFPDQSEGTVSSNPEAEKQEETVQDKYDRSLRKTRTGFGARLNAFFANFRSVDEAFFEELEELLITSDVGVQVASNLTESLRYEARLENAKKPDVLRQVIIEKLVDIYEKDGRFNEQINLREGLTVMLFVGVNGVGKTTSIGKLAYKYKQEGKKVMLVAADTFRAGAVAQLAEWGRRVDVPVVTGPEKSDPASVVFDGMERAKAEGVDVLMIDTAGRLQNKDNLMAELEKIGRIIKRGEPDAPHETFLALDASTGQNALVQAKEFSKITPVTGIVLTKIDGTARGGVVLAIREELDIPVKLIGFGEKIDDIGEFNSENFMRSLLEGLL